MKEVFGYAVDYFKQLNKFVFLCGSLLTATFIFLNYSFHLEKSLTTTEDYAAPEFFGHYFIFVVAFSLPYLFYFLAEKKNYFTNPSFVALVMLAPAIFALKMSLHTWLPFSANPGWNGYWNQVFYWPVRVIIITAILYMVWKWFDPQQPFYGLRSRNINWKPYLIMLVLMIPLIAGASTQKDFLVVYPKLYTAIEPSQLHWLHKLLFELSYGSDFFSIELFFRGFLILAFLKWTGKDAILPMACFYCTIHFGKPLGECISSYFGGLILGAVVSNTRSIWGGLMVHLGIAWLMEVGGYFGHALQNAY